MKCSTCAKYERIPFFPSLFYFPPTFLCHGKEDACCNVFGRSEGFMLSLSLSSFLSPPPYSGKVAPKREEEWWPPTKDLSSSSSRVVCCRKGRKGCETLFLSSSLPPSLAHAPRFMDHVGNQILLLRTPSTSFLPLATLVLRLFFQTLFAFLESGGPAPPNNNFKISNTP